MERSGRWRVFPVVRAISTLRTLFTNRANHDGVRPMLKRVSLILAAAAFALGAGTMAANADGCSGHGHGTGTVLGAVGGGLIGSAITHGSAVGVVGGALAGGLAGNSISRSRDCNDGRYTSRRYHRAYYYDRHHQRRYYE
jgi:osmotically inducible lipoprotein OsmB